MTSKSIGAGLSLLLLITNTADARSMRTEVRTSFPHISSNTNATSNSRSTSYDRHSHWIGAPGSKPKTTVITTNVHPTTITDTFYSGEGPSRPWWSTRLTETRKILVTAASNEPRKKLSWETTRTQEDLDLSDDPRTRLGLSTAAASNKPRRIITEFTSLKRKTRISFPTELLRPQSTQAVQDTVHPIPSNSTEPCTNRRLPRMMSVLKSRLTASKTSTTTSKPVFGCTNCNHHHTVIPTETLIPRGGSAGKQVVQQLQAHVEQQMPKSKLAKRDLVDILKIIPTIADGIVREIAGLPMRSSDGLTMANTLPDGPQGSSSRPVNSQMTTAFNAVGWFEENGKWICRNNQGCPNIPTELAAPGSTLGFPSLSSSQGNPQLQGPSIPIPNTLNDGVQEHEPPVEQSYARPSENRPPRPVPRPKVGDDGAGKINGKRDVDDISEMAVVEHVPEERGLPTPHKGYSGYTGTTGSDTSGYVAPKKTTDGLSVSRLGLGDQRYLLASDFVKNSREIQRNIEEVDGGIDERDNALDDGEDVDAQDIDDYEELKRQMAKEETDDDNANVTEWA